MYKLDKPDLVGVVLRIKLTDKEKKDLRENAYKGKAFLKAVTKQKSIKP